MSQVIGRGRYARETYPIPPAVGGGGGTIFPFQIVQQEPGTIGAPAAYIPWILRPVDHNQPNFEMGLEGALFNTTIDYVFQLGMNIHGEVAGKPVCYFAIEQDFESAPGIHQLECYIQSERTPGVDPTRPFGFVTILTGPDTGKTSTGIQYAGSFLAVNGGPVGGPPVQQWQVADNNFIFVPSPYTIAGTGDLAIEALAGRLTLNSLAGDMVIRSVNPAFFAFDNINIAKTDTTVVATLATATGAMVLLPTTDATGQIGSNTNRFNLVRAVTITSGDIEMLDEEREAHWILREMPDRILAINEITKEAFRFTMVPDIEGYDQHKDQRDAQVKRRAEKTAAATAKLKPSIKQVSPPRSSAVQAATDAWRTRKKLN